MTFNLRVKVVDDDLQLSDVHSLQQLATETAHLAVDEARDANHLTNTHAHTHTHTFLQIHKLASIYI